MEGRVAREKPSFWEEEKTEGVMEMDTIKASEGEKRLMRCDKRCFPFLKTVLLFPLFLFPPLGLISLACPDGLESVPGKTGHPSPPLHLAPPPSPLLLTCPEATLPLHLAP